MVRRVELRYEAGICPQNGGSPARFDRRPRRDGMVDRWRGRSRFSCSSGCSG